MIFKLLFALTTTYVVDSLRLKALSSRKIFSTRFECIATSFPLVSSVFWHLYHTFRVYSDIFTTRFECIVSSLPLVSSVLYHLYHSLTVYILGKSVIHKRRTFVHQYLLERNRLDHWFKKWNDTLCECSFQSSPPVLSVVLNLLHSFWV